MLSTYNKTFGNKNLHAFDEEKNEESKTRFLINEHKPVQALAFFCVGECLKLKQQWIQKNLSKFVLRISYSAK